jgi:hypothetical protein
MVDDTLSPQRPALVTILVVMTFLGTVFYFGALLLARVNPDITLSTIEAPLWISITLVVTQLGKTIAGIMLLGMRRIGFYLYAGLEVVSAIASIMSGKITMDYMESGYVNPDLKFDPAIFVLLLMGMSIGLTILFISGFAAHLGKMR